MSGHFLTGPGDHGSGSIPPSTSFYLTCSETGRRETGKSRPEPKEPLKSSLLSLPVPSAVSGEDKEEVITPQSARAHPSREPGVHSDGPDPGRQSTVDTPETVVIKR